MHCTPIHTFIHQNSGSLIHTHAHPPHSRTPMHAHTFHPCIPMHTHIEPHTPTHTCTSSRTPTHIPHIPAHALNLIKKKGRNKSQWTKKISCSKYQCLKQACISDATQLVYSSHLTNILSKQIYYIGHYLKREAGASESQELIFYFEVMILLENYFDKKKNFHSTDEIFPF